MSVRFNGGQGTSLLSRRVCVTCSRSASLLHVVLTPLVRKTSSFEVRKFGTLGLMPAEDSHTELPGVTIERASAAVLSLMPCTQPTRAPFKLFSYFIWKSARLPNELARQLSNVFVVHLACHGRRAINLRRHFFFFAPFVARPALRLSRLSPNWL